MATVLFVVVGKSSFLLSKMAEASHKLHQLQGTAAVTEPAFESNFTMVLKCTKTSTFLFLVVLRFVLSIKFSILIFFVKASDTAGFSI